LRQNLRNEFLSYRGAYFCESSGCAQKDMKESKQGHNEGDVRYLHGKLQPAAALVFNPGTTATSVTARVTDCKNKTVPVPEGSVQAPGSHALPGNADSWVVMIDPAELAGITIDSGSCKTLLVEATAAFAKGTTHTQPGGIQVE
jgi:hypothetical protein